jgi:hypothetical protein
MTLELDHSLASIEHVPHGALTLSRALSSPAPRPASVEQFLPGGLVVVASYLLVLIILVVLGVCMGWQRPGKGGGDGGGGTHGPSAQEPTPPGGRELTGDNAPPECAGDFAAWEQQLRSTDEQAVPDATDL